MIDTAAALATGAVVLAGIGIYKWGHSDGHQQGVPEGIAVGIQEGLELAERRKPLFLPAPPAVYMLEAPKTVRRGKASER